MPLPLPTGRKINPSGPEVAPVNHSPQRENDKDLTTNDTSGQRGLILSENADLSVLLANKLRAKTDLLGSTLFDLTWKERVTPSGVSIPALRGSVRRTCANDCIGWPTPQVFDSSSGGTPKPLRYKGNAPSETGNKRNPKMIGSYRGDLKDYAAMASWPTCQARDWKGPQGRSYSGEALDLPAMASLATWMTSSNCPRRNESQTTAGKWYDSQNQKDLVYQAQLTDSGQTPNGCHVETGSGGQLNPELPRWLMGFPPEWSNCADTAMQSLSHRRLSSSKQLRPSYLVAPKHSRIVRM